MSALGLLTRFALVRPEFTELGEWREALGPFEPLRVSVTAGPLDAPEWSPAGAMRATTYGPTQQTTDRS